MHGEIEYKVKKHRNYVHAFKIPKIEKEHKKMKSIAIKGVIIKDFLKMYK